MRGGVLGSGEFTVLLEEGFKGGLMEDFCYRSSEETDDQGRLVWP